MTTNTTVAPPGDNAPLKDGLSLRGVTKRFGTLTANDHIDLDIVPGRIHCLLGENGAGKSTLMNILYGLLPSDEGQVYIDGVEQHFEFQAGHGGRYWNGSPTLHARQRIHGG